MKNNSFANSYFFKLILLFLFFLLVIVYNKTRAADIAPVSHLKAVISFKQNTQKNELNITTKTGLTTPLQLFIFSTDGELIKQVTLNKESATTVKNLRRGYYLFQCFSKDTPIKQGTILIK